MAKRITIRTVIITIMLAFAGSICFAAEASRSHTVVAVIGGYKITQQAVDAKAKLKLYEVRKNALDEMIANYLLQQAAKKDNLSVNNYVQRELNEKVTKDVTEVMKSFKPFYNKYKDKFPEFRGVSYEQAKKRAINQLKARSFLVEHKKLLMKLSKQAGVKILLQQPQFEITTAGHPALGPKDAPVTIVEFGDFQCPFCKRAEGRLTALRQKYGNKIRLVFMNFPLSIHDHAMQAASAARCAQEQGKFWQYHDALFANQSKLTPNDLKATAKRLNLDMGKFDACFDKGKYDNAIRQDIAEGNKLQVSGTPTFFIDGRELVGAATLTRFENVINEELAQTDKPPAQRTFATN